MMGAKRRIRIMVGTGAVALALSILVALPTPAHAAGPGTPPTFSRDIAPILQQKCESCHRPDSMAPMPLRTYEEVRPWVKSIVQRVGTRQMPPWHIDKTIGIQRFKNDRSLSDEQIATIQAWVNADMPKGDPKDMPAPKVWSDGSKWQLAEKYGPPDLVIKSPDYTVLSVAQDAWFRPTVPTGITEPRWVRAIEIHPATVKGRKVTHHTLARLRQDEDIPKELFTNDPNVAGDGLFMEWAVGKNGDEMRPGSGRLMLPGSKIVFEMHYHAIGEEITDHVELGVYFYPKGQEPKHREVLALFNTFSNPAGSGSRALDIPPNQVTTTESFVPLRENARIENFQAHMHLRGKGMSMEALFPDGRREMLSQVTNFNFNWHNMYIYEDDAAPLLPKGTILHFLAWYDNTAGNRSNPDPDQWVGWGDRTVDEMGHAWLNITYLNDEDFKAEQAKRVAATTTNDKPQQ
ncbi:MAG: cytochrome c [Acidobacteria bacterium]|nr:cytochrome c [Acidobacteriota bacterium]MBI3264591.1 cytochrome c [Acidobacteriota bacterium]